MMQEVVTNSASGENIYSMSYGYFLDSIRIVYAQVTDCVYDTFMTSIYPSAFKLKNYKLLYLKNYLYMINF